MHPLSWGWVYKRKRFLYFKWHVVIVSGKDTDRSSGYVIRQSLSLQISLYYIDHLIDCALSGTPGQSVHFLNLKKLSRMRSGTQDEYWPNRGLPAIQAIDNKNKYSIFSVCATQLSGCIIFATPDAGAIFLHNDLLCNGTSTVTRSA